MANKSQEIADFIATMYELPVYSRNVFEVDPITYTFRFFDITVCNPDSISDYELRYYEMIADFTASEGIDVVMTGVSDFEISGENMETFYRHTTIKIYDWDLLI